MTAAGASEARADAPPLPRPQRRHQVPRADRPDFRQVRVLVSALLKQSLRTGVHPTTGAHVYPLRQVMLTLGILGLVSAWGNASRAADLESYLILVYSLAFLFVILNVAFETPEVRERNADVLFSQPASVGTFLMMRAALLLTLTALIAGCFGLAPIAAARLFYSAPWLLIATAYLTLLVGAFATAALWLLALLLLAQRVSMERIRSFTQLVAVAAVLGVFALSLSTLPDPWRPDFIGGSRRLSLAARGWVAFLPSTWFARFWIADLDLASNVQRGGVCLTLLAGVLSLRLSGLHQAYGRWVEKALRPEEREARAPVMVRLLGALGRLRPLGGLAHGPAAALATLILTQTAREDVSRLKTLVPRLLVGATLVFGIVSGGSSWALLMLAYFAINGVVEGLEIVGRSSEAAASWPLFATPLPGRHVVSGIRRVIAVRFLLLPVSGLVALLFLDHPPALAAVLGLYCLVFGRLAVPLGLLVRPALPLSADQRPTHSFPGFLLASAGLFGVVSAYGVVRLLVAVLGIVGTALAAVAVLGLLLAGLALEGLAARRLERVEFLH